MKGVVFLGDCELALDAFPDPTPGPGEVVLAMKASGMCGSDLHAYRAPKGRRVSIGRAADEARSGVLAKITERMSVMQENAA